MMRAALLVTSALFALSISACKSDSPPPAASADPATKTAAAPGAAVQAAGPESCGGEQKAKEAHAAPEALARAGSESCGVEAKAKDVQAADKKPLDKKQFGTAITESSTTALTSLVSEPAKFADKTIRTEGVVSAVCKSMGCWMEIGDASGQAHIKMAGHSFFIPREANGHRARIQGKVLPAAADESACKDNCRENAEKETGRVAKIEIEATGVEFLD